MIKLLSSVIFLCIIQNSFAQSAREVPISKLDSIDGVYIPKDLKDTFKQIDTFWSDSLKIEIKKMKESDFVDKAHFGFGLWIRNNWGLWQGSRLYVYFHKKGLNHPDDMSGLILTSYHRYLHNQKLDVKSQIENYKKYWKNANTEKENPSKEFKAKTIHKEFCSDINLALKNPDLIIEVELIGYEKIPRRLKEFKNLQELNIEDCPEMNLKNAIRKIAKIKSLRKLYFFENSITKYPENLGDLKGLQSLWISGDNITNLPKSITKLKELDKLLINECPKINLETVFETLTGMPNLTQLDLSENKLKQVPDNIEKLTQLKELWLDDNNLTEINKGIKSLPNLEHVRFFSNNIKSLKLTAKDLPSLQHINLCYNPFEVFPIALSELKNLEYIKMWYTEIKDIPKDISKLRHIKYLNIHNSNLNEEQQKFLVNSLPNTEVIVK